MVLLVFDNDFIIFGVYRVRFNIIGYCLVLENVGESWLKVDFGYIVVVIVIVI